MTRRWLEWPPSVAVPSATDTPSDVPSTFDSMSWVAKPLPANSTSIQPVADEAGDVGRAAGVDDGRAAHGEDLAAPVLGRPDALGDLGDAGAPWASPTTRRSS